MRILVLGVGNILLTDEAIGVRIVEALEQRYILPGRLFNDMRHTLLRITTKTHQVSCRNRSLTVIP